MFIYIDIKTGTWGDTSDLRIVPFDRNNGPLKKLINDEPMTDDEICQIGKDSGNKLVMDNIFKGAE